MPLSTIIAAVALAVQAPPPARGTVAVADGGPAASAVFADAVAGALIDAGFVVIAGVGHARQVATLEVTRSVRGAVRTKRRPPKASAGGGMTFGNGAGAGVSIPFGAKAAIGQLVATELTLRIARRGASGLAWEGRAVTYQVAGARGDAPATLAKKLSAAIVRNFDGPSGVLVSVP